MCKIRKIVKGSSISSLADDLTRSTILCTANVGETTNTDQNENVFAFTTTGTDGSITAAIAAETALAINSIQKQVLLIM